MTCKVHEFSIGSFVLFFLLGLPLQKAEASSLKVDFKPSEPYFNTSKSIKANGVKVYDHSKYTVKLINKRSKPIYIKSIIFRSLGNVQESGLGDIANYWPWRGNSIIYPGRSISLNKVWGFTSDTPNTQMTHQFEFTYTIGSKSKEYIFVKELVLRTK